MRILCTLVTFYLLISCTKNTNSQPATAATVTDTLKDEDGIEEWEKYEAWQENRKYREFKRDTTVLSKLQNLRDESLIAAFAKDNDSLKKFAGDSIPAMLYTIDVNADGRKDIIFEGSSGSEAFITHIYLNSPDGYHPVFSGYQYLADLIFTDGKLSSFTMLNPGCCADTSIEEHHYIVNWNGSNPKFHIKKSFYYVERMQIADSLFDLPKDFSILPETAVTRMDCYLLNFIEDGPGNETGWFIKGDKGKALGWRHDDGMDWLYVLMEPSKKNNNAPQKNKVSYFIYGWILKSQTDLK